MALHMQDSAAFKAPREEIRRAMIASGTFRNAPPNAVDEIVDLAAHAAESGFRKMLEVLDRTPDQRIEISAASVASGIIVAFGSLLESSIKEFGQATGMEVRSAKVALGGDHG